MSLPAISLLAVALASVLTACGGSGSAANPSNTAVIPPGSVRVSINPDAARTDPSGTVGFRATVSGSSNMAVAWTVQEGSAGGSVDANGSYTAPAVAGTYHVVATSQADSTASATAQVTVNTVLPCTNLPPVGTWEDITPTPGRGAAGTIYNADALMLDPFDSQTIWLGTAPPNQPQADAVSGMYKSGDCGATWTHVNTGANAMAIDSSNLWSAAIDPVTKGTIYAVAAYGAQGMYKTTNGGVDWEQVFPADSEYATHVQYNFVGAVTIDPTNHQHLVVTAHGECSAPYGANGSSCQAESLDSGATWKLVPNPDGLGFQENAGAYLVGLDNWLYSTPTGSTYRTTDHGATWKVVGPGAEAGESAHHPFIPAPDGNYYLPADNGVLQSKDQGASFSLLPGTPNGYGFAIGGGHLYIGPEFSLNVQTAALTDLTKWTALAMPPTRATGIGTVFMDYDEAHHILYTANFNGGIFRMVTQ